VDPTSSFAPRGNTIRSSLSEIDAVDDIFPELPFSKREVEERIVRNRIDPHFGAGNRHVASSSQGIRIMMSDFLFRQNSSGPATGHGFLKFHYKLSGKNLVKFAQKPDMLIEGGSSAIVYHPEGLNKDDCFAADVRELSVTIGCRQDAALSLLGVSLDELPRSARAYFDCRQLDLRGEALALNNQMIEAVYSLINPRFSPWLQKIHMESKILDLMSMSLHELTQRDFLVDPTNSIRPKDVETLRSVKQYLQANTGSDITIAMLCRKFATNRAKLSAGFKVLFGETIFEYMHRLRMDHAMALLTETEMAISEVAEKVGYTHQSSFSTAFRDHHGVAPLNARRARSLS